jgi:hypothetical protein
MSFTLRDDDRGLPISISNLLIRPRDEQRKHGVVVSFLRGGVQRSVGAHAMRERPPFFTSRFAWKRVISMSPRVEELRDDRCVAHSRRDDKRRAATAHVHLALDVCAARE